MRYLKSINEESWWRRKKKVETIPSPNNSENIPPVEPVITKDDLYISYRVPRKGLYGGNGFDPNGFRKRVDEIDNIDSFMFCGQSVFNMEMCRERIIRDPSYGTFTRRNEYYTPFSFRIPKYTDICWYQDIENFNNLRIINRKMGFNLGTDVYVESLKANTKITKIVNGALYCVNNLVYDQGFDYDLTLFYQVSGSNLLYQVTHLEIIKDVTDNVSEVDKAIKDNFYDLIDNGIVEFVSIRKKLNMSEIFECKLIINNIEIESLKNIYTHLDVACKRLLSEGIKLTIKSISKECIEFTAQAIN